MDVNYLSFIIDIFLFYIYLDRVVVLVISVGVDSNSSSVCGIFFIKVKGFW